ncbi:MAG: DMT family transporter [candidate division WOR-3 bacterium]
MTEPVARRLPIILTLGIGVAAISCAAPLIRLAAAPALVSASYRMAISSLLLAPVFWASFPARRAEFRAQPTRLRLVLLSGVFLALHFALWFESLEHTSVASSVLLVTMNPVFLGLASPLLLKERISRRVVLAIVLGTSGALIISLSPEAGQLLASARLKGNLLALAGALMYSAYLLTGRKLRPRVSILSYTYLSYTSAAALLLLGTMLTRVRLFGYPWTTLGYLLLLALIPQLIGHSVFNWALRSLAAPVVALAILGEPIGATLLAWGLLGQAPTLLEIAGGSLIVAAIGLAVTDHRTGASTPGSNAEPESPATRR